jgi:type II secretory pathway predicted ATPase ExeA
MLYLLHYGLKEKPFEETADPKFLWLGQRQLTTYNAVKQGILNNEGITLLTGEVGTGKTVLLNHLAESLKSRVLISRIFNPDLDIPDFLNSLSDSIRPGGSFEDKVSFLSQLILAGSDKKMILVIIDEAHHLSDSLLDELSLLLKIQKNNERMVNIVLAGQETSFGSFNETAFSDIARVPLIKVYLHPLTIGETKQYIFHRLKIAGATRSLFTVTALGQIHLFSGGVPRIINSICDHALLIGYSRNMDVINSAVIRECTQDFFYLNNENGLGADTIPIIPETRLSQAGSGTQAW